MIFEKECLGVVPKKNQQYELWQGTEPCPLKTKYKNEQALIIDGNIDRKFLHPLFAKPNRQFRKGAFTHGCRLAVCLWACQ